VDRKGSHQCRHQGQSLLERHGLSPVEKFASKSSAAGSRTRTWIKPHGILFAPKYFDPQQRLQAAALARPVLTLQTPLQAKLLSYSGT
jgi:hypothetical protein